MSGRGEPGRVAVWVHGLCGRAWPAGERDVAGMREAFIDRRRAAGLRGGRGMADTVAECVNVLVEGLRLRAGGVSRRRRGGSMEPFRSFRTAVRQLARRPGWTLVAIATLGAGIGATTAVFSVVDGVVLRSLPYARAGELIRVGGVREGRGGPGSVSGPSFRDLESSVTTLSAVAASTPASVAVGTSGGPADQIRGGYVSGGFFALLGVAPLVGRAIGAADDDPGAAPVAVLSHALWTGRFGREDVVGRVLELDGRPVTVVGVMGPDFHPPEGAHLGETLLWLPLSFAPMPVDERGLSFLDVIGRLSDPSAGQRAGAELASIGDAIRAEHGLSTRQFTTFAAVPLMDETVGDAVSTLVLLLGAVLALLLISCANVASLMLGRVIDRAGEFAVRAGLGATRGRLLRDVVAESLVIGVAGGLAGAALAQVGVSALTRSGPIDLPRLAEVSVDGRVLGFAIALAMAVGVVVGLVPALRATRSQALPGMPVRGASLSRSHGRMRDSLVVAQAALGFVLLLSAGLLIRGLVRLQGQDPGFRTEGLHLLAVRLGDDVAAGPGANPATHDAMLAAVGAVPGVRAATLTAGAPFTPGGFSTYVEPEGIEIPEDELMSARVGLHQVSAGHLSNLGVRMIAGREIDDSDATGSLPTAVISESLARRYWPDGGAIGSRIVVGGDGTFTQRTVVGIAASPRYGGPASLGEEHVYVPYRQFVPPEIVLAIRADALDRGVIDGLRRAVHEADPHASIRSLISAPDAMARYYVEPAFMAGLMSSFSAVALLLAGVGLYATLAYSVGRRRREFGIRLAVGASGASLARGVVVRGMTLAGLGVAFGMAGAWAASRTVERFIFGVSGTDPLTWVLVAVLFLGIAVMATWVPARRAACTEPLSMMRAEAF